MCNERKCFCLSGKCASLDRIYLLVCFLSEGSFAWRVGLAEAMVGGGVGGLYVFYMWWISELQPPPLCLCGLDSLSVSCLPPEIHQRSCGLKIKDNNRNYIIKLLIILTTSTTAGACVSQCILCQCGQQSANEARSTRLLHLISVTELLLCVTVHLLYNDFKLYD